MRNYPRDLAVRVLTQVLSENRPLDEVLQKMADQEQHLSWLYDLCAGTLRWKGRLDQAIDSVSIRKKPTGELRKYLLLAAYQLIAQDRVHAGMVVSETVQAVRDREGEAPSKFVNACLRKIADHAGAWRNLAYPEGVGGPNEKLCAQWASLPDWIWARLVKAYGLAWAQAFALASLERPTLWLCSKDPKKQPLSTEPGPLPSSWKRTGGGLVSQHPGFLEGEFIVQDLSSQLLIQEVAGEVNRFGSIPTKFLDLCAAPGGKSVGLAWNGIKGIATDFSVQRLALLRETVLRTRASVRVVEWDEVPALEFMDLVWVDAPCSGTGIVRRHPDIRWLKHEKDLASLAKTQKELVLQGWEKVRPGGFLVYTVCSVLPEEGAQVIMQSGIHSQAKEIRSWLLGPNLKPGGDGFWGVLLQKDLCLVHELSGAQWPTLKNV